MTSFVHLEYSNQHPGVARVESAVEAVQQLSHGFSSTRGLATLLLSAVAAAVMVVAYQVMDSVAEGHLMVMWIGMWAVAFAVLASFAGAARNVAVRIKAGLDAWSRSMAASRADERMWSVAQSDPRVMADLRIAVTREEGEASPAPVAKAARTFKAGSAVLRAYQRNYI
ncbi:MAG: hypothetical protein HYX42_16075 [Polaromonas sp.]|uniref:hypothetical protein n=1 Tax=Polaromonas sp. TaxID=1869339 RepID=UPI0025F492D0|nr:hypothetical protein [Polaromonas sp.]MBI2727759.1 hypothetical protein [Polaromonas sp.]